MKSLMILGFPRSMSSLTARISGESLQHQLRYPEEKSGEVLIERYGAPSGLAHNTDMKQYSKYAKILDRYRGGWLIKDVNQPFMATEYLRRNPDAFNSLFIRRPLADNVYCIFQNGWFWPLRSMLDVVPDTKQFLKELYRHKAGIGRKFKPTRFHIREALPRLIDACIHIDSQCYRDLPNTISYEVLCKNDERLFQRLHGLGYDPKHIPYIDSGFTEKLQATRKYRTTPRWHFINGYLRAKLNDASRPR